MGLLCKIAKAFGSCENQCTPEPSPAPQPQPQPQPVPATPGTAGSLQWYEYFWNKCALKDAPQEKMIVMGAVDTIIKNKSRYEAVSKLTGVPWQLIGAIHNLEASCNFNCHLHNGDPLTGYTYHVPAGRPKTHAPPFTWEESAVDALGLDGLIGVKDWTIAKMLKQAEAYNGLGYIRYHTDVMSPYIWAGTTLYNTGRYVADGKFDPNSKSLQAGVAAVFKEMQKQGLI